MTERTARRSLWVASEGGVFGVDPDPTGAAYVNVPAMDVGELEDGVALEETSYEDGTIHGDTAPIVGADGWTFKTKIPMVGLNAAAGDNVVPAGGTLDWLDLFAAHIFFTSSTTTGRSVAGGSTTSSLVLTSSVLGLQSIVPVFSTLLPTTGIRTQWTEVTSIAGAPTYAVAPLFVAVPTTGIAYGSRTYLPSDTGGSSLSFCHQADANFHTLLGGRCTAAKIVLEAKKAIYWELTFSGDSKTARTPASLPTLTKFTQPYCMAMRSPLWFNGTRYPTSKIEIDLGIEAAEKLATEAPNGRSDFYSTRLKPKLMVSPIYDGGFQTIMRGSGSTTPTTTGPVLVQMGAGVFNGSILNTCAFFGAESFIRKANTKDDKGIRRGDVVIELSRMGIFSGTTPARFCQFVRA